MSTYVCTFLDDKDALVAACSLDLKAILEYLKKKNSSVFGKYEAWRYFEIACELGSLETVKFFWENQIMKPKEIMTSRCVRENVPHPKVLPFLKVKWEKELAGVQEQAVSLLDVARKWFVLAWQKGDTSAMKSIWSLGVMNRIPNTVFYTWEATWRATKENVDFLWSIEPYPYFVEKQVETCLQHDNFMLAEYWQAKMEPRNNKKRKFSSE